MTLSCEWQFGVAGRTSTSRGARSAPLPLASTRRSRSWAGIALAHLSVRQSELEQSFLDLVDGSGDSGGGAPAGRHQPPSEGGAA